MLQLLFYFECIPLQEKLNLHEHIVFIKGIIASNAVIHISFNNMNGTLIQPPPADVIKLFSEYLEELTNFVVFS
ncbi:hypothetical protein [Lutibacter sp.]|uniref:hypothetical protein n=1 Tax=Lutibacter sp. TaxID=1925666 RepID=UPI001A359D8E|nr:hypothetical protein [Lutibacter sp.]MBI9039858.1 hypothetical protein [Lutibacter sp.]